VLWAEIESVVNEGAQPQNSKLAGNRKNINLLLGLALTTSGQSKSEYCESGQD